MSDASHKSVPEWQPAFPPAITVSAAGDVYHGFNGMGLRDWFAGRFASAAVGAHITAKTELNPKAVAIDSYEFADAMLAVREASK